MCLKSFFLPIGFGIKQASKNIPQDYRFPNQIYQFVLTGIYFLGLKLLNSSFLLVDEVTLS